ncbi:MAG: DUF6134 family protein [Pseudomonadota bacterium]
MEMPRMTRREAMLGATAGGVGLLWPGYAPAAPPSLDFSIFRKDSRIGHHRVRLSTDGDRTIAEIDIEIVVTFAFIPFYRYRHRNREVWANGRLMELQSETDDDGTAFKVSAQANGDELVVEGSEGELILPGDIMSTSYWQARTVQEDAWFNTQDGTIARSVVESLAPERILAGGRNIEAEHYRLVGDIDCDIWYHEERWSKLRFAAPDGSIIDYVLEPANSAQS